MVEKAKGVGILRGAKHKPGTNGYVACYGIKQHAKKTGHDIHPSYARILETGVKNKLKIKGYC